MNTHDPLLSALGELARDEDAAREDASSAVDPATAELLRPPDEHGRAAIADAVLSRLDESAARRQAAVALGEEPRSQAAEDALPIPITSARRWRRRLLGPLSILAAAAAVLVFVARPVAPPVPAFALEIVEGGDRGDDAVRGEPDEDADEDVDEDAPPAPAARLALGPKTRFTIRITPATAVPPPVELRAFAVQGDHMVAAAPVVRSAGQGVFIVEGTRALLPPSATGSWRLIFAVGRPRALPSIAFELRGLLDKPPAGGAPLRIVEVPVRLLP